MKVLSAFRAATTLHSTLRGSNDLITNHSPLTLPPPEHKRLYLIRHGETDWNRLGLMQGYSHDIELNERGLEQAKSSSLVLPKLDILASSHLQRASQTADQLPHQLRVIHHKFAEMRFGTFEGTNIHDNELFDSINQQMERDPHVQWPNGGESTVQVQERGLAGVNMLFRDFAQAKHIGIVAHGRFNRILLQALLKTEHLPMQEQACINVLDLSVNGEWTPQLLNYVEHLDYQ